MQTKTDQIISLDGLAPHTVFDERTALERRQDEIEAAQDWDFQQRCIEEAEQHYAADDEWTEGDELVLLDQEEVERLMAEDDELRRASGRDQAGYALAGALAAVVVFLVTVSVLLP